MMLCNDTLQGYYTNNFALMKHHGWSLSDLENMLPWERDIYILLTENWVKEQNEKAEQAKQQRGA
tara:strand:+ start:2091 stop:2285 length:195 start_codon:yes stop_codon:yes gene_type:complete